MGERPILFSAPMVRAILEGRKTQTRRVVKPQPVQPRDGMRFDAYNGSALWCWWTEDGKQSLSQEIRCPYGTPGDLLYVKETWRIWDAFTSSNEGDIHTGKLPKPADEHDLQFWRERCEYFADRKATDEDPWRPSIHMPRWASRITLKITDVRVERLQEISEADAMAEGTPTLGRDIGREAPYDAAKLRFASLWESINGTDSWAANPWVWVVGFERVRA